MIKDVKQAYYAVLQSESALEAAEANLKQYQELDRVVLQRVSQEAALKSDSLDVKAKLAHEQYTLVQLRNTLNPAKSISTIYWDETSVLNFAPSRSRPPHSRKSRLRWRRSAR